MRNRKEKRRGRLSPSKKKREGEKRTSSLSRRSKRPSRKRREKKRLNVSAAEKGPVGLSRRNEGEKGFSQGPRRGCFWVRGKKGGKRDRRGGKKEVFSRCTTEGRNQKGWS